MRVSKIRWFTQQENVLTQEHLQRMAPDLRKEQDSPEGNDLLNLDGPQTILVLLLEVLQLALEEGRLHEELINVMSGILRFLRITGGHSSR